MNEVLRVDLAAIARLRRAGVTGVELVRLIDVKRRYHQEQQLRRAAGRHRMQLMRWLVKHGWFTEFGIAAPS